MRDKRSKWLTCSLAHRLRPLEEAERRARSTTAAVRSDAQGVPSRNRAENVHAQRSMKRGQSAYVEPHTCCDRNAPFTVAIRINGRTSSIPCGATLEGEARQLGMMKKGEQPYVVSGLPGN